ncbi:class II aldolase/adducin family protein [Bacillus sp. S3]|uniref:class II aldolase/adducin family protein n=1 Tax=Bacillus sp. S3 TaxID=486398 RepID=UPI00118D059A|nr:class II aldolase/adducin family protein [Bacillus sp. S3]QCJ42752.1 class II aldolase/adducin family protein [Bacillus sp. S3]
MISEIKYKKQICEIGKRIYEQGFIAANNGNMSIRISDNEFLITPTGVSKGFLTPEMIVKVDRQGNVLDGEYLPTSEMKMHLLVYQERPDIHAIVHVHPPYATAFAIAGIPLDQAIMPESVIYLGTIPIAEYRTPSSEEVPNAVKQHVHDHQGVLLENHGALIWGKDLEHAYYIMESLEFTAKINWIAKQLNGDRELSKKHVQTLVEMKSKVGIKGMTPQGVETPDGHHAKKITPIREQSLSEQELNIIIERVSEKIINELKKHL